MPSYATTIGRHSDPDPYPAGHLIQGGGDGDMMLELRCECSHMRYWMHVHLVLSILYPIKIEMDGA